MNLIDLWHRITRSDQHAAAQRLLTASGNASRTLSATAADADEAITRMETRLVERRASPRPFVKAAQG